MKLFKDLKKIPIISYDNEGNILEQNEGCTLLPYTRENLENRNIFDILKPVMVDENDKDDQEFKELYTIFFSDPTRETHSPASFFRITTPPTHPFNSGKTADAFFFNHQYFLHGMIVQVMVLYKENNQYFTALFPATDYFNRWPAPYFEDLYALTNHEDAICAANDRFTKNCPVEFEGTPIFGKHIRHFFLEQCWEEYQVKCNANIRCQLDAAAKSNAAWDPITGLDLPGRAGWANHCPRHPEWTIGSFRNIFLLDGECDFSQYDFRIEFSLANTNPQFGIFFKSKDHTDENAYTLVWVESFVDIKKNGTRAARIPAEAGADNYAIELVCGHIRFMAEEKTLLTYTDPLPITDPSQSRLGVFFEKQPFSRFRLLRRKTAVDLDDLQRDALDVRLRKDPSQVFELHSFPIVRPFAPQGMHLYMFKNITQYRRLENVSTTLQLKVRSLETENVTLRTKIDFTYYDFITKNKAMLSILETLTSVAKTPANVLLLGETGTGKDLLARTMHKISDRGQKAFVKVDCSTLSDNLLESELFGHEKGSFTGANERRIGRFELADRGSLFMDEVGNLNALMQIKLLNVLQDRNFMRVGGSEMVKTDVRIIAATNSDLEALIRSGRFRNDLYYRLAGFVITILPLRERPEDIPLLAEHFLKSKARYYKKEGLVYEADTIHAMANHDWPGNVREMENAVEYAIIRCQEKTIRPLHLPFFNAQKKKNTALPSIKKASPPLTRRNEMLALIRKEKRCGSRTIEKALGLSQATVYNELMAMVETGLIRKEGHGKL